MRMTRLKHRLLTLLMLPILYSQIHGADLRVGKPFPDLVLPSAFNGEPMSLRDFLGQKLIVQIFASW